MPGGNRDGDLNACYNLPIIILFIFMSLFGKNYGYGKETDKVIAQLGSVATMEAAAEVIIGRPLKPEERLGFPVLGRDNIRVTLLSSDPLPVKYEALCQKRATATV